MARASPLLKSFNAGEFSAWLEGRIDLDRYTSSVRRARNFIGLSQGPAICRSGTALKVPVYDEDAKSILIPFIFADGDAVQLEFANQRMRVIEDGGLLVRAPTTITGIAGTTSMVITAAGHGASIGEQVALAGFPFNTNLNDRVVNVTNVAGNDITVDVAVPPFVFSFAGATIQRVFHLATPFTTADLDNLNFLQSNDVMLLFCEGLRNQQLVRTSTYVWAISEIEYINGPYLPVNTGVTKITLGQHGGAIPFMTSNVLPIGTASATENNADAFKAFDGLASTFWAPDVTNQGGTLQYDFAAPHVVTGYWISVPSSSVDSPLAGAPDGEQNALGYAPYSWTFEGWDGASWIVLDTQVAYDAWDGTRTIFLTFANAVAMSKVRLVITATRTSGTVKPRIATLAVYAKDSTATFSLTASAVTGINSGLGFLVTDIGRLVRIQGEDSYWRDLRITAYTSTTVVTAQLQGDPFPTALATGNWRLGYWSDTSGWPTVAAFFDDRLFLGGVAGYTNVVFGSVTGQYFNFRQTETDGTVQDDNALVAPLNSRRRPIVTWMETDERGLIIGTQGGEWILGTQSAEGVLSARNIKARQATARGAARIRPVKVDRAILFVQKSKRTVREIAYVFEADGYRSPSMSIYAQHMGISNFEEMDIQAEPHSIVWVRRADGKVAALTYSREENVLGWSLHDFGGVVESLSVIPDPDLTQDAVWMTVRRTLGGVTRRFIEKLTRMWDLSMSLEHAHFADAALRYTGAEITDVYGLHMFEGAEVSILADFTTMTSRRVTGGKITLDRPATNVLVGIGYQADLECSRIEAGAADGTAQGKLKRIHDAVVRFYQSGPCLIGKAPEIVDVDQDAQQFEPIELREPHDFMVGVPLFTGDQGPITWPVGYEREATVLIRKEAHICLPVNVIAIMPHIDTQDSG